MLFRSLERNRLLTWMQWPVLVPHTVTIDVDVGVFQQLLNIKVASVMRGTAADDPCDRRQFLSEIVLLLDGVHGFGEDVVEECSWSSSCHKVGRHKVRVE